MKANASSLWVLAIDTVCNPCALLASRLEAMTDGRLTISDLNSDHVTQWQLDSFNELRPETPTLFSIDHEKRVKGYSGGSLLVKLVQLIGPSNAWSTMT